MGMYTYGTLDCDLNRDLTEEEFAAWMLRVQSDPPYGECPDQYCLHFYPINWIVQREAMAMGENDISLSKKGFTVEVAGKVYDVTSAVDWVVRCLPAGITAHGDGWFQTEGEDWAIIVNDKGVHECTVTKSIGSVGVAYDHPMEKLIEWAQEVAND